MYAPSVSCSPLVVCHLAALSFSVRFHIYVPTAHSLDSYSVPHRDRMLILTQVESTLRSSF